MHTSPTFVGEFLRNSVGLRYLCPWWHLQVQIAFLGWQVCSFRTLLNQKKEEEEEGEEGELLFF